MIELKGLHERRAHDNLRLAERLEALDLRKVGDRRKQDYIKNHLCSLEEKLERVAAEY
jgi:hypothetical protein